MLKWCPKSLSHFQIDLSSAWSFFMLLPVIFWCISTILSVNYWYFWSFLTREPISWIIYSSEIRLAFLGEGATEPCPEKLWFMTFPASLFIFLPHFSFNTGPIMLSSCPKSLVEVFIEEFSVWDKLRVLASHLAVYSWNWRHYFSRTTALCSKYVFLVSKILIYSFISRPASSYSFFYFTLRASRAVYY